MITTRSALARALLPVAAGLVLLAAIFGATYGLAAWISRGGAESTSRLAPETLDVGNVERWASSIDEAGPILFPGLDTTSGERTIVLDHDGADPTRGWHVYLAFAEGSDPSCPVTQVRDTATFTDCHGDELDVTGLASVTDACPIVENRQRLLIGLSAAACS